MKNMNATAFTIEKVLLPAANPSTLTADISTPRTIDASMPLRLWHLTSLDAPTVAAVWSLAFAWVAHITLPAWTPLLLALTTWSVYVGDRLLDARSSLRTGSSYQLQERHLFHWRHRRILILIAACAALTSVAIIFSLVPAAVRHRDSIVGLAALVYFTGVHCRSEKTVWTRLKLSKELLVGQLFTVGCAVPAISRVDFAHSSDDQIWSLLIVLTVYGLLAWLNCYAIDTWESGRVSRVTTRALSLLAVCLLTAACISQAGPRGPLLLLTAGISALLLIALDQLRNRLSPVALRALADLVLLTPVLILPMAARIA
jgi:hypothetical protein